MVPLPQQRRRIAASRRITVFCGTGYYPTRFLASGEPASLKFPMNSPSHSSDSKRTILLVEADVIVRCALAQQMRGCGCTVIEVVSGTEARVVLLAGPRVDVVLADAQLAGDDNGFALAQWVRRHRKSIDVILTGTLAHKVQVACEFCVDGDKADRDALALAARIQSMLAERKRRLRPAPKTAPFTAPGRKRN
jgi:CheY-like chemotaxis protein